MKNHYNPAIIREGNKEFRLGHFDGKKMTYDFKSIVAYLNIKGKKLFGNDFYLWEENYEVLYRLVVYMIGDIDLCKKMEIDPDKCILLTGPVGCGKTSLMRLIRYIVPHRRFYEVIPTRNITFAFNHVGYGVIEDYGNHGFFCFDDLGVEPIGRHFGKDCNVLGEILLSRHDLFMKDKVKTHITTNLNSSELEARYGTRVRSRMRQMNNLIAFDEKATDKRK